MIAPFAFLGPAWDDRLREAYTGGHAANAFRISRATMANIRQNLFFAFAYNVAGIPVAAGVLYPAFGLLLSPIIASAAMSLSSLARWRAVSGGS